MSHINDTYTTYNIILPPFLPGAMHVELSVDTGQTKPFLESARRVPNERQGCFDAGRGHEGHQGAAANLRLRRVRQPGGNRIRRVEQ